MSSGWGCPNDHDGKCQRRDERPCDPGAEGCVLEKAMRQSAESVVATGDPGKVGTGQGGGKERRD